MSEFPQEPANIHTLRLPPAGLGARERRVGLIKLAKDGFYSNVGDVTPDYNFCRKCDRWSYKMVGNVTPDCKEMWNLTTVGNVTTPRMKVAVANHQGRTTTISMVFLVTIQVESNYFYGTIGISISLAHNWMWMCCASTLIMLTTPLDILPPSNSTIAFKGRAFPF